MTEILASIGIGIFILPLLLLLHVWVASLSEQVVIGLGGLVLGLLAWLSTATVIGYGIGRLFNLW